MVVAVCGSREDPPIRGGPIVFGDFSTLNVLLHSFDVHLTVINYTEA